MWDIKKVTEDPKWAVAGLLRRRIPIEEAEGDVEEVVRLTTLRRQKAQRLGELNRQRKDTKTPEEGRRLRGEASETDTAVRAIEARIEERVARWPNRLHDSVPDGVDEQDNVVLKVEGEPRHFNFPVRDHVELGTRMGLDLEAGVRLSGAGFPVLRRELASLSRQLISFMIDVHRQQGGYEEIAVPYVVKPEVFYGTAHLPRFRNELYWVDDEKLGLIPTAEVPLTNLPGPRTFVESELPQRFVAHSPCFRQEAGAYGRDSRGILRVHQFDKVELVRICRPEDSLAELEILTNHAEEILRRLRVPFRRVLLCSGDTGFGAMRTHDLEVWIPSAGRYREVSSCSTCGDFQARRIGLKVDGPEGPRFAHTLNGSGVAVGRLLIALLENYQEADGSVRLPIDLTV